ncbi:MAG: hypothetical protein EYC70_16385 [Planctomycetota bacterium]|nr:MAG: hypothetical protein EYC70_16385 [Planctomycetota bacterium]
MKTRLPLLLLLLLLAACDGGRTPGGAAVWDPCGRGDAYRVLAGSAREERCHVLTRWFGLDSAAVAAPPPEILSDTRDAVLVSTPSHLQVELGQGSDRMLRAAVRRLPEGEAGARPAAAGPELVAEVFWRRGAAVLSLARVSLPEPGAPRDNPWRELAAALPDGPGALDLVTRWADPAGSARSGPQVAWGAPRVTRAAARQRPPDVLLLSVDALRADALAAAPRLHALLRRGALWPRAVSPSNWTLPSYASLFTAMDADRHGAGRGPLPEHAAGAALPRDYRGIRPGLPTLAAAFRAAGYATAMVHQNPFLEPWSGLDRGFERYVRSADDGATGVRVASEWWNSEPHRPRFLVLHLMGPHLPYAPPPGAALPPDPLQALDWRAFLAADHAPEQRRAFFRLDEPQQAAVRARYHAEVAAVDAAVAPWLEELLSSATPPVLAFHSDHGEELWDEGSFEHGHSFTDAVVRIPIGLVWPGHVAPRVHEHLAGAVDLGPSLLRLARVPAPAGWEGDLFAPRAAVRSLQPLYRAEHGGRVFALAPERAQWLPFDPRAGADGPPAVLDEALQRALAELGYAEAAPR